MKLATVATVLCAFALAACGVDDQSQPAPLPIGGMNGSGGGGGNSDDPTPFVGAYRNTITVSGQGSSTFNDSLNIVAGTTSDLILQSQQLGNVKATIIGAGAFSIDQQQITLTDGYGQAFSVTLEGQGTVTGGVMTAGGTMSSSQGALSFTMQGARL
jgi:hypothetical protein